MTVPDPTLDVGGFSNVQNSLGSVKKAVNSCTGWDGLKVPANWMALFKGNRDEAIENSLSFSLDEWVCHSFPRSIAYSKIIASNSQARSLPSSFSILTAPKTQNNRLAHYIPQSKLPEDIDRERA